MLTLYNGQLNLFAREPTKTFIIYEALNNTIINLFISTIKYDPVHPQYGPPSFLKIMTISSRNILAYWGWGMHISISKLTITDPENGLSPGWCQFITGTNDGILLIWPLGTSSSETLIAIHRFIFKKMLWKCCLRNVANFVLASMC